MSAPMATTAGGIPVLDSEDRKLAGVCAGIARHFGVDVRFVRIAFVVLTLAGGFQVIYLGRTGPARDGEHAEQLRTWAEDFAAEMQGSMAMYFSDRVGRGSGVVRFTSIERPRQSAAADCVLGGYAAGSVESRWFGTMSVVCSNQYRDNPVRTCPFPGMSVGRTTSKAEMRSVATITRAWSAAS